MEVKSLGREYNNPSASIIFVLATLFMVVFVPAITYSVWHRPNLHPLRMSRYTIPILAFAPWLFSFYLREVVRKSVASGELGAKAGAKLTTLVSTAAMITYIAMVELAELTF